MITVVHFAAFVCIHANLRQPSFYTDEGWTIEEVSPGRVLLTHPSHTSARPVAVQGIGYSLVQVPDPPKPEPEAKPARPARKRS